MAFDAGSIEATLILNEDPFIAGLRDAQRRAEDFEKKPIVKRVEVRVDQKALTDLRRNIRDMAPIPISLFPRLDKDGLRNLRSDIRAMAPIPLSLTPRLDRDGLTKLRSDIRNMAPIPLSIIPKLDRSALSGIRRDIRDNFTSRPVSVPIEVRVSRSSLAQARRDIRDYFLARPVAIPIYGVGVGISGGVGGAGGGGGGGAGAAAAAAAASGGGGGGGSGSQGFLGAIGAGITGGAIGRTLGFLGGGGIGIPLGLGRIPIIPARPGSLLGLAGLGPEHFLGTGVAVAASGIGAALGGVLKMLGAAGPMAVGFGTDLAGIGQAAGDIKMVTTDLGNLNRAIAVYGKNSRQASVAQQQLNFDLKSFSAVARPAVLQAAQTAQGFKAMFDKVTGPAEKIGAQIINQAMKVGEKFLPTIGRFAGMNMGVIQTGLQPLFKWMQGPGLKIFTDMENIFHNRLPLAMHDFVLGVELAAKMMDFLAKKSGGALTTLDKFLTHMMTPKGTAQWEHTFTHLMTLFDAFKTTVKLLARDLHALFSADANTGLDLIRRLNHSLQEFHHWATSPIGHDALHNFFVAHRNEMLALINAIGPLLTTFGKLEIAIAPGVTNALTTLLKLFNDFLNLPVIGQLAAWGIAISIFAKKLGAFELLAGIAKVFQGKGVLGGLLGSIGLAPKIGAGATAAEAVAAGVPAVAATGQAGAGVAAVAGGGFLTAETGLALVARMGLAGAVAAAIGFGLFEAVKNWGTIMHGPARESVKQIEKQMAPTISPVINRDTAKFIGKLDAGKFGTANLTAAGRVHVHPAVVSSVSPYTGTALTHGPNVNLSRTGRVHVHPTHVLPLPPGAPVVPIHTGPGLGQPTIYPRGREPSGLIPLGPGSVRYRNPTAAEIAANNRYLANELNKIQNLTAKRPPGWQSRFQNWAKQFSRRELVQFPFQTASLLQKGAKLGGWAAESLFERLPGGKMILQAGSNWLSNLLGVPLPKPPPWTPRPDTSSMSPEQRKAVDNAWLSLNLARQRQYQQGIHPDFSGRLGPNMTNKQVQNLMRNRAAQRQQGYNAMLQDPLNPHFSAWLQRTGGVGGYRAFEKWMGKNYPGEVTPIPARTTALFQGGTAGGVGGRYGLGLGGPPGSITSMLAPKGKGAPGATSYAAIGRAMVQGITTGVTSSWHLVTAAFTSHMKTPPNVGKTWLTPAGHSAVQGFVKGLTSSWQGNVVPWLSSVKSKITQHLTGGGAGQWLTPVGHHVVQGFQKGLTTGWTSNVVPWLTSIKSKVTQHFTSGGAGQWLTPVGHHVIEGFHRGLTTGWTSTVVPWLTSVQDKVTQHFTSGGAGQWLTAAGHNVIHGFYTGVTASWSANVVPWLTSAQSKVKGYFASAGGWLTASGLAVVTGFYNGLESGVSLIQSWASQVIAIVQSVANQISALTAQINSAAANASSQAASIGQSAAAARASAQSISASNATPRQTGPAIHINTANFNNQANLKTLMNHADFLIQSGRTAG
jgi:hypothetical protein